MLEEPQLNGRIASVINKITSRPGGRPVKNFGERCAGKELSLMF